MKRILSAILVLIMTVSMSVLLSGCGEKDKFVGSWVAEINMADAVNSQLAEIPQFGDYIKISDFNFRIDYTFNSDSTYTVSADNNDMDAITENLKTDFKNGIAKYFEAIIKAQGYEMTVDEFLSYSGTSLDEFMGKNFDENELTAEFNKIFDSFNTKGTFKAKDGILATVQENDTHTEEYYEFINDTEVKLTGLVDEESYELDGEELSVMDVIYPMTLKKK